MDGIVGFEPQAENGPESESEVMGIYDRDYMRNRDPEETNRQYEKERQAEEYGDVDLKRMLRSRKVLVIAGIVILVVLIVGYLCSL